MVRMGLGGPEKDRGYEGKTDPNDRNGPLGPMRWQMCTRPRWVVALGAWSSGPAPLGGVHRVGVGPGRAPSGGLEVQPMWPRHVALKERGGA